MKSETVNHPEHYQQDGRKECIEEMVEVFGKRTVTGFCLLNAYKYLYRYSKKNGQEDIEKANWYLSWYLMHGGSLTRLDKLKRSPAYKAMERNNA